MIKYPFYLISFMRQKKLYRGINETFSEIRQKNNWTGKNNDVRTFIKNAQFVKKLKFSEKNLGSHLFITATSKTSFERMDSDTLFVSNKKYETRLQKFPSLIQLVKNLLKQ